MQNFSLKASDGLPAMEGAALAVAVGESAVPSKNSGDARAASRREGGGGGGGVCTAVRFARRASRGSVDMMAEGVIKTG